MRTLNSTHIFHKEKIIEKKWEEYAIKADVAKQWGHKKKREKRDHKQFSGQIAYRQYNFNQLFYFPFPIFSY